MAALVQKGDGSDAEKEEAAKLFKRFFDVVAYETVFSGPIY